MTSEDIKTICDAACVLGFFAFILGLFYILTKKI